MNSYRELSHLIGAVRSVDAGGFIVHCRVRDVRVAWGKAQAEVEPLQGRGRAWVQADRLAKPSDTDRQRAAADLSAAARVRGDSRPIGRGPSWARGQTGS